VSTTVIKSPKQSSYKEERLILIHIFRGCSAPLLLGLWCGSTLQEHVAEEDYSLETERGEDRGVRFP
jgi:hypothetical protein